MKEILISIDLEHDIGHQSGFIGVEKSIPILLDILKEYNIKADFFTLSKVVEKFTPLLTEIVNNGHSIGNHGFSHDILCKKKYELQLEELCKSNEIIENKLNIGIKMFRAPNFSVNGDTIRALEELEYIIDTSVLPGRSPKKWKMIPVYYNFSKAPRTPYHPSFTNVSENGKSRILEIPITENPFAKGQPIGMGYLNLNGVNKTLEAIEKADGEFVIFLIHPWEMLDISSHYPDIKNSWKNICSDDNTKFSELLERLKTMNYKFSTLYDMEKRYRRIK
jgi:peptidoglycan/xylan/chitin deacetylase (PgdA/CDA1 family)